MKQRSTEPSQRQLRVGEQLRHVISDVLKRGHFDDPLLFEESSLVSVSEVRASPDLRNATAYIVSLGGKDIEKLLPALNHAAPIFQKEIGRQLNLKFTPRIHFSLDKAFEEGSRIDLILSKIRHDSQE